jgi:hypothetical protein
MYYCVDSHTKSHWPGSTKIPKLTKIPNMLLYIILFFIYFVLFCFVLFCFVCFFCFFCFVRLFYLWIHPLNCKLALIKGIVPGRVIGELKKLMDVWIRGEVCTTLGFELHLKYLFFVILFLIFFSHRVSNENFEDTQKEGFAN